MDRCASFGGRWRGLSPPSREGLAVSGGTRSSSRKGASSPTPRWATPRTSTPTGRGRSGRPAGGWRRWFDAENRDRAYIVAIRAIKLAWETAKDVILSVARRFVPRRGKGPYMSAENEHPE